MTVFEKWVIDTVKALVRDMREEMRPAKEDCRSAQELREYQEECDALHQRLAISLVQSRALECRQIAASMLVKQPPTLREIVDGLNSRSSQLEALGMAMAKRWPPEEKSTEASPLPGAISTSGPVDYGPLRKYCTCGASHRQNVIGGLVVCDYCNLPIATSGNAAPGPVVIQ